MHKLFTVLYGFAWLASSGCSNRSLLEPLEHLLPTSAAPGTISITINDYCPAAGNTFKDVFALNKTAEVMDGTLLEDFDGDGVPNILDANATLGINPYIADSNNDGYSDLMVYLLGVSLASQAAFPQCLQNNRIDTDHDGLNDCEEALIGTSSNNADTDGDGIPDYLEVRFGLDPLDPSDAGMAPTGDNVTNYQKVKMNLPPNEYYSPKIAQLAYQYSTKSVGTPTAPCFDFTVSNIQLAQIPNGNQFTFYMLEQTNVPASGTIPTVLSVTGSVTVDSLTPSGSELTYSFQSIKD